MGAVITDPATHRKIDVVSPLMAPRLALVDPEVTVSLPPGMTAATGMDALTHSIEGYTATLAHPLTDALHRQAIELLGKYLLRAYRDGADKEARYYTMMASMIAGIGFPNSGLGAVHGLALPLGGRFNIAHGVANAILLPHVMAFNLPASRARLRDIGVALGAPKKSATGAIEHVFGLRRELKLPLLASFGIGEEHLDALARDALGRNTNCVTNPRPVTEADAKEIYRAALREG
jgi:alcohol dehydrogenase class IV